jgi:hypothetical protein
MLPWPKETKSHYISIKTKCKLYNTLIRPVLLYGCETWAINRYNEEKIAIFERKVLRKIYGPTCDNGRCRIRYNNELYKLFGEPDIIRDIKARRVKWLGHLFRTNEYHPCRMLTFATLYGTRRVGRPPIRWLESIEEDLRNIGVGIWKRMAVDRDKRRIITGAVKTGTRL